MNNVDIDIKQIREARNLTQQDFATAIGITREMLGQIERGQKGISKATRILINEFLKKDNKVPSFDSNKPNLIPYYPDINASAGMDFLAENGNHKKEMIDIPNVDAQAFINVFGDSMYPKFCAGEIIGIKQVEKDYVMFGNAYVIQMKNGEAYLKYIQPGNDDSHWQLTSENKHYAAKQFHLDKIDKIFIIKAVITKTTL